ncbi:MAG: phosphatase [Sphingobium sp.]|nr:phosphatase [Sphingobium sp.]
MRQELIEAEAKARAARDALTATLVEIQSRITPRALAREAIDEIRETGIEFGRAAVDAARRNPGPLLAILATVLALFGRNQLAGLFTAPHAAPPSPTPDPETPHD